MKFKLSLPILLLTMLTAISAWGQQVKLVSISPTEGETVSTLDVTLTFDIEEAAESQGLVDDCSIFGNFTFTYYSDYGTDKEVNLGSQSIKYNGQTEGASYSKLQEFYAPAPYTVVVDKNLNYSVVISGYAAISQLGKTAMKVKTRVTYQNEDEIILSYIGKVDPTRFNYVGSSLDDLGPQSSIPEVILTFTQPISILGKTMPFINRGSALFATAKEAKIKTDDPCSVVLTFDEAPLHKAAYTVVIPKGFIAQKDKTERTNVQLELPLTGELVEYYSYTTTKPEINGVGLEENYFIEFNLPADQKLPTSPIKTEVYLYENEVNEENMCKSFSLFVNGSKYFPHELEIPINYSYKPDTKYIFVFPENVFNIQGMYINSRIEIPFTTPSVETSGYAPMKFKAANGRYGSVMPEEFVDNKEYDKLGVVDLVFANYRYQDWDLRYNPAEDSDISDAILYDITSGERKETGRAPLSRTKRETKVDLFYALTMTFDNPLYANHEYELVIPTKEVGVSNIVYSNFIPKDDEFILKLKGSTPVGEPYPVACSLNDNQEVEALHTVHWTFPAGFILAADSSKAKVELSESEEKEGWLDMSSDEEGSYLTAVFNDRRTGEPVILDTDQKASVVLPAGTVVFAGLPDEVTNEEIRIPLTGKHPEAFETVSVKVVTADFVTSEFEVMKGEAFTLRLTPDENWTINSLTCNNNDITYRVENGVYTVDPLDTDSQFDVELEYVGTFAVVDESGLVNGVEIKEAGLKVYKQDKDVIIEGTQAGDSIAVYTISGQQIAMHQATDKIVRLTLTHEAAYIIRVNDHAVKIIL